MPMAGGSIHISLFDLYAQPRGQLVGLARMEIMDASAMHDLAFRRLVADEMVLRFETIADDLLGALFGDDAARSA